MLGCVRVAVDIEPHIFALADIENGNPFVKEVLRTGVEI
jgi:hypothetical protein